MNHLEYIARQLFLDLKSGEAAPLSSGNSRVFIIPELGCAKLLSASPDIYAAINGIPCQHKAIGDAPLLAFETNGWASPMEEGFDGAPSQHPLRRRVRLVVVANREGDIASALGFSDDPDEIITSPEGRGILADAITDAMRRLELVQSVAVSDLNE